MSSNPIDERAASRGISPLGGRPRKEPPPDAAERIRECAADGWSVIGCAWKLGTSHVTFARWLEEFPELRASFELGREHQRHTLHNLLYRRAVEAEGKDSTLCAMYLLNSRFGYRQDTPQDGARVAVNITLPGAMSPADYARTISATSVEPARVEGPE